MNIRLEHNGYTESNTFDRRSKSYSYIGLENDIKIFASSFNLGAFEADKGVIDKVEVTQKNSVFWNCKIDYVQTRNNDGVTWSNGTDEYGKKQSSLSSRLMQVELESHLSYLYNWNHVLWLYKKTEESLVVPEWWATSINGSEASGTRYAWTSKEEERPTEKPVLTNEESEADFNWFQVEARVKKSDYWEVAVWEISEKEKCTSQSDVGNKLKKAGKITSPSNGDFGRTGEDVVNWRCDGGNGGWDGKHWVANVTLTGGNWDTQLYGES